MVTKEKEETQMRIKVPTWERLMKRKKYGESFDDTINRMINEFPEEGDKNED